MINLCLVFSVEFPNKDVCVKIGQLIADKPNCLSKSLLLCLLKLCKFIIQYTININVSLTCQFFGLTNVFYYHTIFNMDIQNNVYLPLPHAYEREGRQEERLGTFIVGCFVIELFLSERKLIRM